MRLLWAATPQRLAALDIPCPPLALHEQRGDRDRVEAPRHIRGVRGRAVGDEVSEGGEHAL
eukprot:2600151-Prymnesium_polylepis.1